MDADRMERAASHAIGAVQRAWLEAIGHLRTINAPEQIEQTRTIAGIREAGAHFAAGRLAGYSGAAQGEALYVREQLRFRVRKKLIRYDPMGPSALEWAQKNQLDAIREIDDDTRAMIRRALVDGARSGVSPLETARTIRGSIGLTEHQLGIVDRYRTALESGNYSAALGRQLSHGGSDRTIEAALRNEKQLTQAQIDLAVQRYRDGWIRYRAETIARTEGLRAAHQGSDELYRQAVERGDLRANQITRTWVHSPGAKKKQNERPFHVSMSGQTVGYGEVFVSGIGGRLRYPCDPDANAEETVCCRCVVTTRVAPDAADGAGLSGEDAADEGAADGEGEGDAADEEAAAEEEAVAAEEEDAAAADVEEEAAAQDDAELEAQHQEIEDQIAALEAARRQLPQRR